MTNANDKPVQTAQRRFNDFALNFIAGMVTGAASAFIAVSISLIKFEQQIQTQNALLNAFQASEAYNRETWRKHFDERISRIEKKIDDIQK